MGGTLSSTFVWASRPQLESIDAIEAPADESASRLRVGCESFASGAPARATRDAAGYDVRASERVALPPRSRAVVPTGVKLAMPSKVYAEDRQVAMYATLKGRSGLAKRGIDVHTGTIDADYRGEILAIVINTTDTKFVIERGDRVAQLIFGMSLAPDLVPMEDADIERETPRGSGGFGSTGVADARVVEVAAAGHDAA